MTNQFGDAESPECGKDSPCVSQFLDDCPQDIECQTIIKALVAKCGTCNETYAFEMQVRTVVSKRCSDQVPDALKAKIFQALEQAKRDT